jgi:hypothetical protein
MELDQIKNSNHDTLWKTARWGVLLFCFIHLVFELFCGNPKTAVLPVFFNFWISAWYIKRQIKKGKEMDNLVVMGLAVSGVVFLIRLVLAAVLYLIVSQANIGKAELAKNKNASNLVFEKKSIFPTFSLLVPKFYGLTKMEADLDSNLFITTYNKFCVYGFEDKNSEFKEFLYDFEFKTAEQNKNADSVMRDISDIFSKAMGLQKTNQKYSKIVSLKAFEGFYKSKDEEIRFLFRAEQRGRYLGILCTVAPVQYYSMQDSIIKEVLFVYPYDKN